MEWWKIALVIVGIVPPIISLIFSVYACVIVGARSERKTKNTKIEKGTENEADI